MLSTDENNTTDNNTLSENLITEEDNRRLREKHFQDLLNENHELKEKVIELTAMCFTLARRFKNEAFSDNITSVQRQQLAEMAMARLKMTPDVYDFVHKSEEEQQQPS
jgi:hypothetical protein